MEVQCQRYRAMGELLEVSLFREAESLLGEPAEDGSCIVPLMQSSKRVLGFQLSTSAIICAKVMGSKEGDLV